MSSLTRLLFSPVMMVFLFMLSATAQAAMVNTNEILSQPERTRLVQTLNREDVRQHMIELGVDPEASLARVNQMSDEEVAELNNRLTELPAGAGISTVDLLLIIIIILLLA